MIEDVALILVVIVLTIQIFTIATLSIYLTYDIYRKANNESHVRLAKSLHDSDVQYAVGVLPVHVRQFRKDYVRPDSIQTNPTNPTVNQTKPTAVVVAKRPTAVFEQGLNQQLKEKLANDSYIITSVIVSKFAKLYSPLHAKSTWDLQQLNNSLSVPPSLVTLPQDSTGTALVLPTGHVINKARGMNESDRATFLPLKYTPECSEAPLASRINLYGYGNSVENERAFREQNTELHLCPCPNHKANLKLPNPESYSSDPTQAVLSIKKKRLLLPGPGTGPIASSPVNIERRVPDSSEHYVVSGGVGEAEAVHDSVQSVAAYGKSLVNLPDETLTLALNCICTDRQDGVYPVGARSDSASEVVKNPNEILYRDVGKWFNTHPLDAIEFSLENVSDSWLASGKPISSLTCKGERIVNVS